MNTSSPRRGLSWVAARALDKLATGGRMLAEVLPRLVYSFYIDENPDYRVCVLVAGSGRAGTTWLAEIINYDNAFRFMFEPFSRTRCQKFGECQYLRPEDNDATYLTAALEIFSGRVRNRRIDRYNRKLKIDKRLVKDIRVNLMLGWIRAHFPEMPIILLLRHPCAVAYSRCMNRWAADLQTTFLSQPALMYDYLEPFRSALTETHCEFERHILWWCVENYVPLMQLSPGDVLVTTYEDCVMSPMTEIKRVFDFLQKPFHGDILKAVAKPSLQTRWNWRSDNASPIVLGESTIDAWQRFVNPDDVARAVHILQFFGLDTIYGADPLPNTPSIARFMRADSRNGLAVRGHKTTRGPS